MTISAVVIAKNAAPSIKNCLESLTWCEEIIVVDDNSIDDTVMIAQKFGAKIYTHALNSDFSAQRNFGLEKATGDWILFVDADEVVSKQLAQEIQVTIDKTTKDGYYIKRVDTMWGKKLQYGEAGNIYLLRLAKKNAGIWCGKVHETWEIKGKVKVLKNILMHYPHPTINEFLSEINFYTTLRAQELFDQKKSVSVWQIIFYPKAKFIQNYFLRQGFKDGIEGLVYALFMSFHSFLVRGKLWQLNQEK